MNKLTRLGAIGAAATLAAMAAGPALAAPLVSQASANALTLSIAGNLADTGTVTATNDGTGETKEGETTPPISVLGNQQLLNAGVLAQDATAQVDGTDGVSAACAGVAGEGASVAEVGDSNCLTPGQPVGVTIANLDLSGSVLINPESALGELAALNPVMDQVLGPITAAVTEALAPLGEVGVIGTLGAVEGRCVATPTAASGSANIVDTKLSLLLAGEQVDIVELPVEPAPNTKVLTGLDVVVTEVIDALETNLQNTFDGQLAGLTELTEQVQANVVDTLVAEIAPQLAPLEENVLDITLNKQSVPAPGAIEVTALDAQVLPAAQEFADASLVGAEIGNVTCGPNGVVAPAAAAPEPAPAAPEEELPEVPTVVDAGLAGGSNGPADTAVAGLLALTGLAGLVGYRKLQAR